jgi:glutathione S-transferase
MRLPEGGGVAMSLTLHFHPLSSFCHKALIALYENGTPFTPQLVDLLTAEDRTAFRKLWPIGKFPVLQDHARGKTVPESSIIIDYLDRHYPGRTRFVPSDAEDAHDVRLRDRLLDLYVHLPMQQIVADRLRPEGARDAYGVAQARAQIDTALGIIERDMEGRPWAAGDTFTLADCAAAPALFYTDKVAPLAGTYPHTAAYLERLKQRPSYARVLKEAEPYFHMFPQ